MASSLIWNDGAFPKLWLYNLHYFDDLNAEGAKTRTAWHEALINRWVRENPPGTGVGWDAYPASLRIVNWVKWALSGNGLRQAWLGSLAMQVRWLERRLEWHLLGNHLFSNAKALVFAGLFFQGEEAEAWLRKGLAILAREIPEQILADGGQFEGSPMYHALVLEDILDLINLARVYPSAISCKWQGLVSSWPETAARMRRWLQVMCHPDGEIAFFNDAAVGIAPSPETLAAYAFRLGFPTISPPGNGLTHLEQSGYIRVQQENRVAILDVAPVGPDYLPGHAHADTLSFELSLFGERVIVNSGTSCYGVGPDRQFQRSTSAHNTVSIDGEDSSEVWGGFRVARRARPFGLRIDKEGDQIRVSCAHDGYRRLPGKAVHRRTWLFTPAFLEVTDSIEGRCAEAVGRIFFSPKITDEDGDHSAADQGSLRLAGGHRLEWSIAGATVARLPSTYHPEFGLSQPNRCLEYRFTGPSCHVRLVPVIVNSSKREP